MPRVSVIVPLYNKVACIDRCLDSILNQSLEDFELIVVNDGSTDGGEKAVERRKDSRLSLISQKNAGPGAARNRGARLARSPLLAFLDGDDAWHRDYLSESAERMDQLDADVAGITWAMTLRPAGVSTAQRWKTLGIPNGLFRAEANGQAGVIIAMLANMLPSSTVMRKSAFDELGGYYDKYRCVYSEDAWLYLKMLLRYRAAFDHRALTIRFEDASELALNLKGVRPVEPFLIDPDDLIESCPEPMLPLLREVLARRALKTASVYGYWGEFRQSWQLVRRFVSAEDWRLPYFITAMVGCTPLGGWAGRVARAAGSMRGPG
jgi:glycosyltransferase involved in cell wall biosynthesis